MSLSKKPYRGTRDFFPDLMRLRNFIFQKMSLVSEQFCYEPYDGPLLEDIELYLAKSGEELINEQIYSFQDRGERTVVIRPEMTPTVARMVAQIHREVAKPIRWYAIPNLMRYEKPQRGRLREFWQYNADIFGAGIYGQVEILQLAVSIMLAFGANKDQFEILVNDRKFVDIVFSNVLKLNDEKKNLLYKLLDKKSKIPDEKYQNELATILQDKESINIFHQYTNLSSFSEVTNFIESLPPENHHLELLTLFKKIESLKLSEFIKYDPTIVRGLDYYTGLVFEIFDKHPENRRAIAGGGAYANLLQIFDEQPLEGVGFGMGEVPLTDFLTTHNLKPDFSKPKADYLIAYLDDSAEELAFYITDQLRLHNSRVELFFEPTKPKKVFNYAEKKDFEFLIMIGEEDQKNDLLRIKKLSTREETIKKTKDFLEGLI
jgi:histidyl-tRNA synthetase